MSEQVPATNQSFYDRISHAYDLISDAGEHKAREQGDDLARPATAWAASA